MGKIIGIVYKDEVLKKVQPPASTQEVLPETNKVQAEDAAPEKKEASKNAKNKK